MSDARTIGTLGERGLHAELKEWYAGDGDLTEEVVDGYHVDVVRDDLLIEIQTGSFSHLKKKLRALTETQRVRLAYPVAGEKWIVRINADGTRKSRRKSPKRGRIEEVFRELVAFPDLLASERFELEVLVVQQEEFRVADGRGSWRRSGTSIVDSRLLEVTERRLFTGPADFVAALPDGLPEPFSTLDLAQGLDIPRWLAQKMAYCLRTMGAVDMVGKEGNALLYVRSPR